MRYAKRNQVIKLSYAQVPAMKDKEMKADFFIFIQDDEKPLRLPQGTPLLHCGAGENLQS